MGQIILDYPSHLRIETVQGCTRSCITCPVSPNKKQHKYLSEDVFFCNILPNIDSRVRRIEFSMHGEPLLNNNLHKFIKAIKNKTTTTQISIISNGDLLTENRIVELFSAGLNFIHVDVYTEKARKKFLKLIKTIKPILHRNHIEALKFIKGGINIWKYYGGTNKTILLSDESLGFNKVEGHRIRNIHTWSGNLPYERWKQFGIQIEQFPMSKKCTEPMKCAPIDIYGNVTLCCADSNKSIVYGSLKENTMYEIWHGETINKVRFLLSKGLRKSIPACYFCNRPSFRVGLWPYKGKQYDIDELYTEFYINSNYSENLENLFSRVDMEDR